MARHRIRYVGGIDTATATAFMEETATEAVLVTSLELYSEATPPKIAMISRLVSTGEKPEILWMDGVGMAGDDSPGILDLGLIEDPGELRDKALRSLVGSLSSRLAGETGGPGVKKSTAFQPKISFNASFLKPGKKHTIGVIPFFNEGERKYAGEIMALHFVRQLAAMDNLIVVEPGLVRERLLGMRIIMPYGISRTDLDIISNSLRTDYILTGKVFKYEDYEGSVGAPKVDFSALLLESAGKKTVWASKSYNQGDDSVYFFDSGRMRTAHATASKMVGSILALVDENGEEPMKEIPDEIDRTQWLWQ
jgi:hypothetical protein